MTTLSSALAYARLVESSATLRLLRKDVAPFAVAVLSEHLGSPGSRLPVEELHERIDADLEVLRDHVPLRQTAKAYCDEWRGDGILVRRPANGARGETYELSSGSRSAIRVFQELEEPRSTLTESRLMSLAAAVHSLAVDTDPLAANRLQSLLAERATLDARIARVETGDVDVLDDQRAVERATDVLLQAQDLPADFARVRARFEELNHELRTSILVGDATQRTVLADVFRGVNLIESSDEGRTFTAFSALIRDPERSAALEADVADVLGRDFAHGLPPQARRSLRHLVRTLKSGSGEVHEALTDFARGLRRYVHSQEFQRDRVMRELLREALAAAVPTSQVVRPFHELGARLELSSMRLTSVGELSLHDPSDFDTGEPLVADDPGEIDFAALAAIARETEIDFRELASNVNTLLDEHAARAGAGSDRPSISVSQVLERFPASQGLASVVGLLSLAITGGARDTESTETLTWAGTDGVVRRATVDTHLFTERIDA